MQQLSKPKTALKIIQFALVIFGTYVVASLFEVWAYLPFWVKNLALVGCLGAVYWHTRKTLQSYKKLKHYQSPAEIKLLGLQPAWKLHALSIVVIGGLVLGVSHAGSGIPGRILQAMTFSLNQPPTEILLNLTITPPSYLNQTGTTLLSEQGGPISRHKGKEIFTLPEGSILTVEIKNTEDFPPFVSLGNSLGQSFKTSKGVYLSKHVINETTTLDIRVGPYVSIQQSFDVIPDAAPIVAFATAPALTKRQSYEFEYSFSDDHGVEDVYLELKRRGITGTKTKTIFLPVLAGPEGQTTVTYHTNLLSHPWAGTSVNATIKAVDGLGQISTSQPVTLLLPEKTFQNPVAQTLISIRKALLITPERKNAQVRRLNTLTNDKAAYQHSTGIYLALRSVYWKLRSAETARDFEEVARYLWQTALNLEGNGSYEEQNILALMERMAQMLADGQNLDKFDYLADTLQTRMENMFDLEFTLLSRRLSLNETPGQITLPGMSSFKNLIAEMQAQTARGETEQALKTLLAFRAMFEQRPTTLF